MLVNSNSEIAFRSSDGAVVTTSLIVAAKTGVQHRAVLQLIKQNQQDFEDFGLVAFEMRPRLEGQHGGGDTKYAVLNRDQALLLITYMRNNAIVRAFKKALVKAFSALEEQAQSSAMSLPQDYVSALRELAATVEAKERAERQALEQAKQIEVDKPKVLFADAVSTSKSTILVGDLAKILRSNGIEVGATRLFAWLRANGFLCKAKGSMWNKPMQKSVDLGLFDVKETAITHSDGHVTISLTPKVTGKGQEYFVSRFLSGQFSINGGKSRGSAA